MTTLTSAGQLAAINVMVNPGKYIELLISQLTINVRYAFMSVSLSQKADSKFKGIFRWLLGFFITDEIFAVAITEKNITRSFFIGLATAPYFGWATGTLIGSLMGAVLPKMLMNALSLAIYAMFVAVVAPEMKKVKSVFYAVFVTVLLRMLFYYAPILKNISGGLSVSICAVLAAVIAAIIFPVKEQENE